MQTYNAYFNYANFLQTFFLFIFIYCVFDAFKALLKNNLKIIAFLFAF